MKSAEKAFLIYTMLLLFITLSACTSEKVTKKEPNDIAVVNPKIITDTVPYDTDDPAIWINSTDIKKSLILGTDKNRDGGLYVFDLDGHIIPDKTVRPLERPNNVDVEYGLKLAGKPVDIAAVTERLSHKLRIFSLPDMVSVDGGGIEVFEGESGPEERDLMGISLYKRPADGAIFAIVGRKTGPSGTYLWQYLLYDDGSGNVKAELVRKFGEFSGRKEIEAIAVDDNLGYVYYSDEGEGVRKYYADPSKGNEELALFATEGFQDDHEGISIYQKTPATGYIIVSDQGADKFHIFPREGTPDNPQDHPLLKIVKVAARESDGSEVTSQPLGDLFPKGLFVAMSNDRTFHYYSWEDIIGDLE
jgi:3-phytase